MGHGKYRLGDERRFWKYVDKTDTCWNWTGATTKKGYGSIGIDGKMIYTHRYSWYLATGKWSELLVLHKCNNKHCVNPDHLYEGTVSDNKHDSDEARWKKRGY